MERSCTRANPGRNFAFSSDDVILDQARKGPHQSYKGLGE